MTTQAQPRRQYVFHISPERRAQLNRERYENMRRGREAKRAEQRAVNTRTESQKDAT